MTLIYKCHKVSCFQFLARLCYVPWRLTVPTAVMCLQDPGQRVGKHAAHATCTTRSCIEAGAWPCESAVGMIPRCGR